MEIKGLIERIGYFRNKQNLSARELSLRIGKHEGYINKLESKDFNLTAETLLDIIDALGITVEEFFAENYNQYAENKCLMELVENLPKDKKQTFIQFLKNL